MNRPNQYSLYLRFIHVYQQVLRVNDSSWVWCYILIITALRRLKQNDLEFKASLDYLFNYSNSIPKNQEREREMREEEGVSSWSVVFIISRTIEPLDMPLGLIA
jgi:hypothetical protein